jgi:hypothetical protein
MKSKKTVCILLASLLICQGMHGQQNVDQLFRDFAKEKGVMRVGIGKVAMAFASLFTDVMGVRGVEVLSFEECDASVTQRLETAIASLKDDAYETMISANEDGQRTKILVKIENESIKELIVLTTGKEAALVRIRGNIKPSDIENVINSNKK